MVAFVVPGSLNQLTGGYIYDRHIIEGLKQHGHRVLVHEIDIRHAAAVFARIRGDAVVIVDGLAAGVLPNEIAREAKRLRFIALVHHPLAYETGIASSDRRRLRRSERESLRHVRRVVVTSPGTARLLTREYAVPGRLITCVQPGTERMPRVLPPKDNELLCVATLTPRKGHVTLIRALARLKHLDWHLTCLGALDRDRETVRRVRAELRNTGLVDRVSLVGETSSRTELRRYYHRAKVFVLPTEYEGYGMAVAEAIANAVPVISTPTGAIEQLVGRDAGILVPPSDVPALARAVEEVLTTPATYGRFRAGALRRRMRLPTWNDAASSMAKVVRQVEAR